MRHNVLCDWCLLFSRFAIALVTKSVRALIDIVLVLLVEKGEIEACVLQVETKGLPSGAQPGDVSPFVLLCVSSLLNFLVFSRCCIVLCSQSGASWSDSRANWCVCVCVRVLVCVVIIGCHLGLFSFVWLVCGTVGFATS